MTSLSPLVAAEHGADLRRAARQYRTAKFEAASTPKAVALRLAEADDARVLKILAELDEEPGLNGEALLALVDGEVVAAMSLDDARVVSNPFVATSDVVSLLKLRANHLLGRAVRQPRRRWRWRFA
jgi:hypothetical protein